VLLQERIAAPSVCLCDASKLFSASEHLIGLRLTPTRLVDQLSNGEYFRRKPLCGLEEFSHLAFRACEITVLKQFFCDDIILRGGNNVLEAEKSHLAQRTYEIYEVAVRCHLIPALGPRLLCDIGADTIAAYQARRKGAGASARTINKELQVLRQILKRHKPWAHLQGDVKFEREHCDIGKALTREEEKKLLNACASNALLNAVVTLALNTALRKNEIRTLRWSQIDFEQRTVTVGRAKTQAGTGRMIPLNQPAFEALVKWAGRLVESNAEDYVFPACEAAGIEREHPDRERIDPTRPIMSWRSAWRAALKRAGLQLRFHDLRHTCITKLAESQTSEQTLMAIAGHVSRSMIEHYSHIRLEAKRTATDAIVEKGVHQNVHQPAKEDSYPSPKSLMSGLRHR
jgi:integrase